MCGDLFACFAVAHTMSAGLVRDRIEPVLRYIVEMSCAVCRVACLEWDLRIGDLNVRRCGHIAGRYCPLKYFLQKRLRDGSTVSGKHLGCSGRTCPRDRMGIAVRTKWQSGSDAGNASNAALMGNHLIGNERQLRGKSSPYLSRKIYSACRRC